MVGLVIQSSNAIVTRYPFIQQIRQYRKDPKQTSELPLLRLRQLQTNKYLMQHQHQPGSRSSKNANLYSKEEPLKGRAVPHSQYKTRTCRLQGGPIESKRS